MAILFGILFFLTPLILWPFTSEVFEFNKMVFVYLSTIIICALWIVKSINERKFIFRRTILDIPLLVYMGSSIISTLLSLDPRTSFFGYYSRFNGGLLSIICYSLLYWAFVSNLNKKQAMGVIYSSIYSSFIVCVYGVLQHFGIDKKVWQQDVQNRIFSTLGQPNWLASYLLALLPITWVLSFKFPKFGFQKIFTLLFSVLFFVTLLFTKSRSGILAFIAVGVVFWVLIFWKFKKEYLKEFLVFNLLFLISYLVIGNPIANTKVQPISQAIGTSLETGGTDSGEIRKIVWKGALNVAKAYPIFGSGLETFAYSYSIYKPREHNLVSEWDYIYNKAHNEFLNHFANSGSVGLISYLFLIGTTILVFYKNSQDKMSIALLSGYIGILVTNFFNFSVVTTQLFLFLFPAISFAINHEEENKKVYKNKLLPIQKTGIFFVVLLAIYLVWQVGEYWKADTLYLKAKVNNKFNRFNLARENIEKAVAISPSIAVYRGEQADIYRRSKEDTKAIEIGEMAVALSPYNLNLRRLLFAIYANASSKENNYAQIAIAILENTLQIAPNDAKLLYTLGITYDEVGLTDKALENINKSLELKPKYKDARFSKAEILLRNEKKEEAKVELEYILAQIDPNDEKTKKILEELN